MHISNCQNPQYIIDPHTGSKVRVRCGKCSSCLNAKAKNWINRLLEESSHHRYSFMVNLTYDDYHLPMLINDDCGNLVWKNRPLDLCVPFTDINDVLDNSKFPDREKEYYNDRLADDLHLPALCMYDVQLFNKRLNKYIKNHFTNKYGNFRYFVAGEYGPSTYRPHFHCLYWLDSKVAAENFSKIVSACWQNGDSSVAHIYSKGGYSYVAQYVNMSTHLPAIYSLHALCQKHIFSKCPPIGSPTLLASEIRGVFDNLPTKRAVWDAASSRYVDLPVNATFKSRFFPKCEGYSRKSDFARIGLYRATEFLPSEDYEQFADEVYSLVYRSKFGKLLPSSYERCLMTWIPELSQMFGKESDKVNAKLYKIYLVSKRFCFIRDTLQVSSGILLKRINDYYKKLDYERLKDFYRFQEEYSVNHPLSDLVHMYPEFSLWLKEIVSKRPVVSVSDIPRYLQIATDSFGYYFPNLFAFPDLVSSLSDCHDFKIMSKLHDGIYKDTHKAHDIHSYRHSEKFRRLNPKLQKIILKYESYGS